MGSFLRAQHKMKGLTQCTLRYNDAFQPNEMCLRNAFHRMRQIRKPIL